MCNLAALRDEKQLSRQILARRAGCTSEYIRLLEADQRTPTITVAYAIASALGVTVEDIWPVTPVPETSPGGERFGGTDTPG